MTKPLHPSEIRRIPMRYTATISTHHGWWWRYYVSRLHGVGIPEKSHTYHRSLKGAERAARRWTQKDETPSVIVGRYGYPDEIGVTTSSDRGVW